eukprot:gnl/TRDRNA2_/TRDRNA2_197367_c0_seq1.p1 gnl/TRDRNA2_/TRDRNA2_197367_c0~~gnl/TRDRNA2_/TRDRNA2_197367_c0_seq1.p1  ORF type:complete len:370 (-),score=108.39 gnl/TRDRNA2_/TRDRNA2_197367_c0_seq1:97-1161(-)
MPPDHPLSAAARTWEQLKGEFEEKAEENGEGEGEGVSADELKKVGKWLTLTVTKFGALAANADEGDAQGLKSIAEEVIKAFIAAIGTLLSIRKGAGPSLRAELREVAGDLAASVDTLGSTCLTKQSSANTGKVLERAKRLERISTNSRSAIRRRLLQVLKNLRDADRELQQALKNADEADGEDAFSDDDLDETLEPCERRVVEALVVLSSSMQEGVKQASADCAGDAAGAAPVTILESVAMHAEKAARIFDSLSAETIGGLETKQFAASLTKMNSNGLWEAVASHSAWQSVSEKLTKALAEVQAALDAAVAEEEAEADTAPASKGHGKGKGDGGYVSTQKQPPVVTAEAKAKGK